MLMVRRLKQVVLPLLRLHELRGERKALWRESDTVPAAGMMLNDTYL